MDSDYEIVDAYDGDSAEDYFSGGDTDMDEGDSIGGFEEDEDDGDNAGYEYGYASDEGSEV